MTRAVSHEGTGDAIWGVISRTTERATVMVKGPGGEYRDLSGEAYCKYCIPLEVLTKVVTDGS